jgi:hypothetical protein
MMVNLLHKHKNMGAPQEQMSSITRRNDDVWWVIQEDLEEAQEGMQQPSPEEMAMMQQPQAPQQGGQDEMAEVIQEVAICSKKRC